MSVIGCFYAAQTYVVCLHQTCHLVEKSITKILNENDNACYLLDLHDTSRRGAMSPSMGASPTRSIRIK